MLGQYFLDGVEFLGDLGEGIDGGWHMYIGEGLFNFIAYLLVVTNCAIFYMFSGSATKSIAALAA